MQILSEPFRSYDDYYAWADNTPGGEYYEVVDGQPVVSPGPLPRHQRSLRAVFRLLDRMCPAGHEVLFAPFDWVLWESPRLQVRQPDAIITRRIEDPRARALFTTPLLAVEVLSPSSVERDTVTKRRDYAQAGLLHYWVVDPETPQVAAYRPTGDNLDLVAHATGNTEVELTEPFAVRFRPADLLT